MAKAIIFSLLFISMVAAGQTSDQKIAFEPIDHTYIYDVNDDGSVKCTWSTTILPKEPTIIYTYSFRGGETKNYQAEDSLGQMIDPDVNEDNGQRTISLLLAGYPTGKPYQFNLSFDWSGLLTRNGDRHTLYTSVNVGDPQAAGIIVIPPQDSRIGTSVVTKGNSSEPFQREMLSNRNALIWRSDNTGNDTEIVFRANFNYYSATMRLMDNVTYILIGLAIIIIAALLLGYRKKLPGMASKIKERI
ncbi:MAG TPA: hypothetical protein VLB04_09210 [Methanotrichaceae archaeon]|nr:hypothetical protein [Methanotrichaceae archaeon]